VIGWSRIAVRNGVSAGLGNTECQSKIPISEVPLCDHWRRGNRRNISCQRDIAGSVGWQLPNETLSDPVGQVSATRDLLKAAIACVRFLRTNCRIVASTDHAVSLVGTTVLFIFLRSQYFSLQKQPINQQYCPASYPLTSADNFSKGKLVKERRRCSRTREPAEVCARVQQAYRLQVTIAPSQKWGGVLYLAPRSLRSSGITTQGPPHKLCVYSQPARSADSPRGR
jgi:hypothetical protein